MKLQLFKHVTKTQHIIVSNVSTCQQTKRTQTHMCVCFGILFDSFGIVFDSFGIGLGLFLIVLGQLWDSCLIVLG